MRQTYRTKPSQVWQYSKCSGTALWQHLHIQYLLIKTETKPHHQHPVSMTSLTDFTLWHTCKYYLLLLLSVKKRDNYITMPHLRELTSAYCNQIFSYFQDNCGKLPYLNSNLSTFHFWEKVLWSNRWHLRTRQIKEKLASFKTMLSSTCFTICKLAADK